MAEIHNFLNYFLTLSSTDTLPKKNWRENCDNNKAWWIPPLYFYSNFAGEEIYHIYELKNRGPSTIQEAEVYILWPSFDDEKKHLLYLLGVQSEPQDKVTCKSIANINPLYVKVKNIDANT